MRSNSEYHYNYSHQSAPPESPSPPTVRPHNYSSLSISWTPPWSHPVNYYTLFINSSNNNETFSFTTTEINFDLMKESHNFSTCEELYFSVAASTDVGLSERSNKSTYGFIKGNIIYTNYSMAIKYAF